MTVDKYYVYRPLLNLIGLTEGTDKRRGGGVARGYNETLAYGALTGGDVELVAMTLSQIDGLQTKMLRHPANHWNSSALGRYQIVRTTLRKIRETLNLPGTALFDAAMQDRMACFLLGQRGIDKYLSGRLSEDTLLENLAKEWASLPTPSGKGYYSGQHAAVRPDQVRAVLAHVRRRHAEGQPMKKVPVPVPKPTVPDEVEQKVKEKTGLWQWLTGLFSSGALSVGWLAGMDWRAIVAIGGLVLLFLVVILVMRRQIVGAVREIKGVVEGKAVKDEAGNIGWVVE